MEIAEVSAAAQKLAKHKRRPAPAEHFGSLGDGTELAISPHDALLWMFTARIHHGELGEQYRF
jgi:hypothetical protein